MDTKMLHTPVGVRDIYGDECRDKLTIQRRIHDILSSYGYSDIQTPTFEYFDIFNKERGSVASNNMYKFFDREGYTLVLRPDMTPSIARAAAKYYMDEDMPIRLCYTGNVYINNSEYQGKLKELSQIGCELLGDSSSDADAEIIVMVVEALIKSGLKEFQVEIGMPEFFKGLVEAAGLDEDTTEELRALLEAKKYFGLEDVLEKANVPAETKEIINNFQNYFGSVEMIQEILDKYSLNDKSKESLERLIRMYNILKLYGVEKYVSFDLSMLSMYRYYSGFVFKAYTYGTGDAVVTGGRYDHLLSQFGKDSAALGFAVDLDKLMVSLSRQHLLPEHNIERTMIIYSVNDREKALNYSKPLRTNNECVIMVRKRSNHNLEEYKEYASKYNITKLVVINDSEPEIIKIER